MRNVPLFLLLVVEGVFGFDTALPAEPAKPNIIVIYTDDQGYGDASCFNANARFETPNFDRLAREGMLFTDAHCADTVCTPSRYGLLTGRYAWRTTLKRGVMGAEGKCLITDDRLTLPSLLRDHGYATAMIGKWHLGMDFPGEFGQRDWSQPVRDMPLDRGFDFFWGIPASMNYGVLAWFDGRHPAVPPNLFTAKKPNSMAIADYRIAPPYQETPGRLGAGKGKRKVQVLEVAADFVDSECLTRFTDKALEWSPSRGAAARNGKPCFVDLPYTSPHKPVVPIERFRGRSKAGAYGDFMIETDWHIGRVLKLLDDEKLAENTLVLVTSDNGPENTWPERFDRYGHRSNGIYREGKRAIYEGGLRIPFIVRWPRQVAAGSVWEQPVCQTDLLATFAELLGAKLPDAAGEDSVSFLPVLTKDAPRIPPRPAIVHHAANGRFAIRDKEWKLVLEHGRLRRELYNVTADPSERTPLQRAGIEGRLVNTLTSIVVNGRTTAGAKQPNDTPYWPDLTWMSEEQY